MNVKKPPSSMDQLFRFNVLCDVSGVRGLCGLVKT